MTSFLLSLVALVLGYVFYGAFVERLFGIDNDRSTPAIEMHDSVDFVPMSWPRIFLIQFLNIAGLGPIFGAILGALYGPAAFVWIVLGCIFAGAVHDYFSGMMSVRHQGKSIPEVVGIYLGSNVCRFMRLMSIVLLLLVVNEVATGLLGSMGGLLAILGVIACPITSGDTAFRSMRLILADMFKVSQHPVFNRLALALPIFLIGYCLTLVDFSIIWRYFAFSNQALATIVLWTAAVYMVRQRRNIWIVLLPATFMTGVCSTYILMAPEGLGLSAELAYPAGILFAAASGLFFIIRNSWSKPVEDELV